jgi:hypothetical protein
MPDQENIKHQGTHKKDKTSCFARSRPNTAGPVARIGKVTSAATSSMTGSSVAVRRTIRASSQARSVCPAEHFPALAG